MSQRRANTLSLSEEDILIGANDAGELGAIAAAPDGSVPSVIAKDVIFTGNIIAKGCVQIEGELVGDIECNTLITGDDARIVGAIMAESVLIAGRAIGPIKAARLMIQSGGHVQGDVQYTTLRIDSDAYVEGQLSRISKEQATPKHKADEAAPGAANVVSITKDAPTATAAKTQLTAPPAAPAGTQSVAQASASDISAISQLADRSAEASKWSA